MDFSPPRLPRNAPSYLIWSIFTKEREERRRQKAKKVDNNMRKKNNRSPSPLSQIPLKSSGNNESDFHNVVINARLAELENEIEKFRKENIIQAQMKRKIVADRKKLAEEIATFEKNRETEKKKSEEERKRLKRDKMRLEREKKEKSSEEKKADTELEELQTKVRNR